MASSKTVTSLPPAWITPTRLRERAIGEAVERLQANVASVDMDRLSKDAAFITLLGRAGRLAIQNHAKEKLEALRNAVLNAACGHAPEEELQEAFMSLLEQFTVLHMRLIAVFREGLVWSNEDEPSPMVTICPAIW